LEYASAIKNIAKRGIKDHTQVNNINEESNAHIVDLDTTRKVLQPAQHVEKGAIAVGTLIISQHSA
jgi:hypothetical protein